MGHVRWVAGYRWVACPYLQQFLDWEEQLAEKASSTLCFWKRMTTPEVRVETCWGLTVTTTQVACLVPLESLLRLRYRAERIGVALSLRIACLRYGKSSSSSSSWGRKRSRRACIANCTAVGARMNWAQGFSPTGNDWFRDLVRDSK